jgi:amino acid adenylation domain-containing protein
MRSFADANRTPMSPCKYALTTEQERLWIEWKLYPSSAAYNNYLVYKLSGDLDVNHLVVSIKASAHDDVLKIIFFEEAGVPYQKILEQVETKVDLLELPSSEAVQNYIKDAIKKPFDLTKPFPYRFFLIKAVSDDCFYLVFVMHHILIDGKSVNLFFDRVSDFYNHVKNEAATSLDFRDYLNEVCVAKKPISYDDLGYWKNKLQNGLTSLDILDNAPKNRGRVNGRHHVIIPPDLVKNLKALAYKQKSTLFLLLMSALKTLFFGYFNCKELVFLYTTEVRPLNYKKVLGYFVSTLPMVSLFSEEVNFVNLLASITQQRREDKQHQNISLLNIFQAMRASHENIDSSKYVIFSKTNLFVNKFSLSGVDVEIVSQDFHQESLENLSFCYDEDGNIVHFLIDYNKALFEDWFIQQLATHFVVLLESILKNPFQKCSSLSFIGYDEIHQGISSLSLLKFIPDKIAEYAVKNPSKIALIDGENKISYQELNSHANKLAHYLSRKGVKYGDFVGLIADRSSNAIVSILSILKLGAAYVPIDPRSPLKRISYILENCACRYLLTEEIFDNDLQKIKNITIFSLNNIQLELNRESSENLNTSLSLDTVMYIIYTSGTTGTPKGVPITYGNIGSLFTSSELFFDFNSEDVWPLFHSLSFDFSVWEWCGALSYGGTLVTIPYSISRSPEKFYELVSEHKITVLNQTPSAFYQFIEADKKCTRETSLRYIIFGGEKLEYKLLSPWFEIYKDNSPSLYNMYGITEGTIHVTIKKLKNTDTNLPYSVIGEPLPHMQTYVLNERKQIVPFGCVGELYITGFGLTSGYLDQPLETAKRFVKSPFSVNKFFDKLYATGDLVKKLPSGELIYLGRQDTQVSLKGFRIELTEIECSLDSHSHIKRSVVSLEKEEDRPHELIAHLVLEDNTYIAPFELRQYLLDLLPLHMIPTKFFKVNQIPLTINGKIDYAILKNLKNEELSNPAISKNSNPIESMIAQIWKNTLGLDKVDMDKNFFDSGGDSLLLLKVHSELENIFQYEFAPSLLFSYPTISSLSQYFYNTSSFSEKRNRLDSNEAQHRAKKRQNALVRHQIER